MNVTKRLLGKSLVLVGGLAFIDLVLSIVRRREYQEPILDLVLRGDLDTSGSDPVLFNLWLWVCPGNGQPAFCDSLGWFFLLLGVLAVGTCLIIALARGLASTGDGSGGVKNRRLWFHNLAFYASAVVAVGYCWTLIHFFIGPDYAMALSVIYIVVATVTPPLFVVVTIATGRRRLARPVS